MYVTPGPNNAMVLASGLKFGFLKTIPHMSGILYRYSLTLKCLGLVISNISTITKYFENSL